MLKQKIVVKFAQLLKCSYKFNRNAKVIKFKQRDIGILSDEDIGCLFAGIINLIKSNACKKAELKYKKQLVYYQDLLNLNMTRVVDLENEIEKMKLKTSK